MPEILDTDPVLKYPFGLVYEQLVRKIVWKEVLSGTQNCFNSLLSAKKSTKLSQRRAEMGDSYVNKNELLIE